MGTVTASAQVVPASSAQLGFVLSANVKEVRVGEGDTVSTGQALIVLDALELSYAETAAEEALKSAVANEFIQSSGRRKWNGFKFVWVAGPPEQRQLAHARVLQAQARLEAAQAELAQATLFAPFDGTVASIDVSPGELVRAGQLVAVMGDLKHFRIETTDLSEREISRIRVGQRASVQLKALSNVLIGTVSSIMPEAGQSPDGDTIYKVSIELDQQPSELRWGMTGDVEIYLNQ